MDDISTYIKSDLYRYCGKLSFNVFLTQYFLNPGFKFMVWHRIAHTFRLKGKVFYFIPWLKLRSLRFKYGYDIPAETKIGKGFYIGHFGGVVISGKAIIGNNCNISQGVTIGYSSRGAKKGYPIIGDNVFVGPGVVVIGNIKIENDVAIGANAVVLDNVKMNAVVVGNPAKIVNFNGSEGYILNKI